MLAVFRGHVAHGPQELSSTSSDSDAQKSGIDIITSFTSEMPNVLHVIFNEVGGMAYTHHKQALLRPRSFAVIDDIFCLFQGNLENLTALKLEYGLAKNVTEVMLIIEAYRALRDRGPFPADKVVSDLNGKFVFILYDASNCTVFVALDCEGNVPFYWGRAADGSLAFSDTPEILISGCGKSFAPFPPGCYFSSNMGLQSYEHPLQKIKPVPRVDSEGQELGAGFKVDMGQKDFVKQGSMHRSGSETNWSESI